MSTEDSYSSFRLPPQNIEAEESVLASCLLYPEDCEKIIELLRPEYFYKTAHQKIFSAINELSNQKIPIDLISLANKLKSLNQLEEIGGATYLVTLTENIPVSTSIEHHVNIIIDKAAKRTAIQKCNEIAKACFDDTKEAHEIIDSAQNSILSIKSHRPNLRNYELMSEILLTSLEVLDERFLNKGKITGVPTGFSYIDELTWGLQNSDLIIIAARPSIGKSSLCLNIMRHAAIENDPPLACAIFSMEMSKQQLTFKFLADLAKINTQKFKSGMFTYQEWQMLSDASIKLNNAAIVIDDSNALTINEIRHKSRQMVKYNAVKLIVIDYIQLMSGTTSQQNRNQDLTLIANGLKDLAKELNIPIIAISQLNRKVEDRNDKRPHLSDLRESGSIEQSGDVIAFIYRDEVYNKSENNPLKGIAEFIIAKNRTGPTGTVRLSWVDKYASFYNLIQNDPYL